MSEELDRHRPLLFRLCYRMTGSAADSDDLVQETFARALEQPPRDLERDLAPWLSQVALNLSRDHLRRRKRQGYVGTWLPAPIETEGLSLEPHPDARYSELESVSMAFLVALDALSSSQRAVVILCDVLGHSVKEAAELLEKSENSIKVTHHRARAALARYDETRAPLSRELQQRTQAALFELLQGFVAHDVGRLEQLLSEQVVAANDSAGEYHAARIPVRGRERVIKFHLKIQRPELPRIAVREINGLPALVGEFERAVPRLASRFVMFITLDRDGRVREVNTTVASGKLTHIRFDNIG